VIGGLFAKPAVKWGAIGIAILLLIGATLFAVKRIYGKGETAGKAEVTTKVQEETIKKTDEARKGKVEADETIRAKPIDAVIDGLR
jgi:hypothetical protein